MDCPICRSKMEQEEVLSENETSLSILFECPDCGYSKKYSREQTPDSLIVLVKEEIPAVEDNVDSFLRQTKYLAETLSRDGVDFVDLEDEFRIMLFSDDEYVRDSNRDFKLGLIAGLDGNKI